MKLSSLPLRNARHTVVCAGDAETGLVLARSDRPDLILMDIPLPGMDGPAATAVLKRDPALDIGGHEEDGDVAGRRVRLQASGD